MLPNINDGLPGLEGFSLTTPTENRPTFLPPGCTVIEAAATTGEADIDSGATDGVTATEGLAVCDCSVEATGVAIVSTELVCVMAELS